MRRVAFTSAQGMWLAGVYPIADRTRGCYTGCTLALSHESGFPTSVLDVFSEPFPIRRGGQVVERHICESYGLERLDSVRVSSARKPVAETADWREEKSRKPR